MTPDQLREAAAKVNERSDARPPSAAVVRKVSATVHAAKPAKEAA